jgi:hypothetical protein
MTNVVPPRLKQVSPYAVGLVVVLALLVLLPVGLGAAHAALPHVEHVVAFAPKTYWMD